MIFISFLSLSTVSYNTGMLSASIMWLPLVSPSFQTPGLQTGKVDFGADVNTFLHDLEHISLKLL